MSTVVEVRSHPPDESVSTLLPAALAGDRAAWDQIVRDHTNLLWWIARTHRLDDATAADVVQTVWLQLIRFGDRITDPSRLRGWLATTARRESLRRAGAREVPIEQLRDAPDRLAGEPDERVIDDERLGAVLAAFESLPAKDQRLLRLMCDVPPKTYEEIAAILGRSAGHLGPTRQRALARLRALLSEQGAL